MTRRNKVTIALGAFVAFAGRFVSPAHALAPLPSCTAGVYELCINFCDEDPMQLCEEQMAQQYGCTGSIYAGWCQVSGDCDSGESVECYIGWQ
jgi:hypothetical protein